MNSFAGHKDRILTLSYIISTSPTKNKTLSDFNTNATALLLSFTDRYTDAYNNTIEHTWQNVKYLIGVGQNINLNYGNLVPLDCILYKLAETQNIGLTYNMRISRSNITMFSPYVDKSDPTALSYGNTNLDCEKSHNINLVYNFFTMKWMVNLTLRESYITDDISWRKLFL